MFEATFDLAEAEPDWALECLENVLQDKATWQILKLLARHTADRTVGHGSLVDALAAMYSAWRAESNGMCAGCCATKPTR